MVECVWVRVPSDRPKLSGGSHNTLSFGSRRLNLWDAAYRLLKRRAAKLPLALWTGLS